MTMQSVGPFLWPPRPSSPNPTTGNITIDAADEMAGVVCEAPKAGNIAHILWRTRTVTTGATVDVRMETVDTSNAQPSGTLFGTNTNGSQVVADANDNVWFRTSLTASATVAIGDIFATLIKNPSSSFGNMQIAGIEQINSLVSFPYIFGPLASNLAEFGGQATPIFVFEYDDGSYAAPEFAWPVDTVSNVTANTGSNPDEVAVYFTPQAKMRAIGWYASLLNNAAADYRVQLYESGNNTPLAISTRDATFSANSSQRWHTGRFAAQTLAAGTTYRLGFLPTTGTNISVKYWEAPSAYANVLNSIPGLAAMHYSSRNRSGTTDPDSASWTEIAYRRLFAGLLIDQLDDGAGGGGGAGPFGGVFHSPVIKAA